MPVGTASDWVWPHDQYDPVPAKNARRFRKILSFEPPQHSPLVRRIACLANGLYLRVGGPHRGAIKLRLPASEIAKLRAIPEGSGNILVGPHPGPFDSHLMFQVFAKAHAGPAVFLMAAEAYFSGTAPRRFTLNRLGVIPVARGRKNPEAVLCMSQLIASGWWGGIFPEGEVYFSREVMPMEYGAMRIAVEAALEVQRRAAEAEVNGGELRPIFLTPFSHVYFFEDRPETLHRAELALRELESHPMASIEHPSGDLPTRFRRMADQVLENKARQYGIPGDEWHHEDRFERTRRLQDAVLRRLEMQYIGHKEKGYARRRAMRVRMACFERLADNQLSPESRKQIDTDVLKTRELILMTPFSLAYREKYGDLEMWVEYIRRFRGALDMAPFKFGPQVVTLAFHDPIDVHPIATEYARLKSEESRRRYLYKETQSVREIIQAGVDRISLAYLPQSDVTPAT